MNWVVNEIHFVIACLFQKGCNTCYIHVFLDGLCENTHVLLANPRQYLCAFIQVFMPYCNFEFTKAVNLHCGKGEGGIDPATEVTHFGLN